MGTKTLVGTPDPEEPRRLPTLLWLSNGTTTYVYPTGMTVSQASYNPSTTYLRYP